MNEDRDFRLFSGMKNVLLFYIASAMLAFACIGLYKLVNMLF
jgi:hypothetical protein|tara:strand:- start:352 stop:477 length:126 start_codon:yes stop_codon:yes gene_type:complete